MMKKMYTVMLCSLIFLFTANIARSQERMVTGEVADQQGVTLPGVTVTLKGTSTSAATDSKGKFKINVPSGQATLVFSFVGLRTMALNVSPGQTNLQVTLLNNAKDLNEVVVVGYGTQKKADLTGSVGSIKGSDLVKTPAATVDQLLQGKVPGLVVINPSGQPGTSVTIRVRGLGSRSDANPLVVIDGIPFGDAGDIKQVNPEDIASVDVLKDASATAIYGSRGANGVILITTKKGKTGQSVISFSSLTTISSLSNKLDVWHDPVAEATIANESALNSGQIPLYTGQTLGGTYYPSLAELRGLDPSKPKWPYNTNWANLVYHNPLSQNYTLSAYGGTEKGHYAISGNYYDEQGLAIDNGYKKYTFHVNLDQKLKSNVTLGVNLTSTWTYNYGNNLSVDRSTIFPAYQPDGSYFHIGPTDFSNPLEIANSVLNKSKTYDLLGNAYVSWDIIPGLNFKSVFNTTLGNAVGDYYEPNSASPGGSGGPGPLFNGYGDINNYNSTYLANENYLTYDRNFGKDHHLTVLVGYTDEFTTIRTSDLNGRGFINNILQNQNLNGATTYNVGNSLTHTALQSVYGRLNYSFLNRYLFTFTGRDDGSSKFGANNKFAFFPSGAVAWKISEEPFMKALPQISELKLRGSYGLTGNQGIAPYQTLSLLGTYKYFSDGSFQTGYGPQFTNDGSNVNGKVFNGLGNKSLKWETTRQLDIGFDLGLLNQRFTLTADYYYKHTTNLLRQNFVAESSGYTYIEVNDGTIDNKGLELGANAQIIQGPLSWSLGGTFTLNRNKVLDIGGGNKLEAAQQEIEQIRSPLNYYINGAPALVFLGYKYGGINQTDGAANAVDGTIQKAGDIKYIGGGPYPTGPLTGTYIIGNPNPKFVYSFNTALKYGQFDLTAQFYGVYGNDIFNFDKFSVPSAQLQRWTPDNPTNLYPRVSNTVLYATNWYVESGSFLRIQNVNLGYTFKPGLIKGISNLRVYFSGNNLYTFTKFNPSFDPEVQENGQFAGGYRKPRALSLGVNVSF